MMPKCPTVESRSVAFLEPEFSNKLFELSERCKARNIELMVSCTVRGPAQQGRLWCRSRSEEEVAIRKKILENVAPTMAAYLRKDWCGLGPPVTEHLPGQSWHQWGEAADVFVLVGGKAVWDGSLVKPIAELAAGVGLFHSYSMKGWEPKRRHWHIQLRKEESPLLIRGFCDTWGEVEREMSLRFLGLPVRNMSEQLSEQPEIP